MIVPAIVLATVASFIASALLYAVPPVSALISRTSTPRPGLPVAAQMASVVLRSLIVSCLVAGLMIAAGWHGAGSGSLLGLALCTLPLVLLMGGVVHENTAMSAAGVHLLDWILKLVIIGAIVGSFV
ncbi:DUF1761 domain-containing protein [Microbacterium maritypicum]|uniref:DUF1761 domain-containing protein n=1 Tax=Microbacterium TaxID=33882 RepID=UPI00261041C4|nr:DUF1761 domain-containing protein [Microbacterium sp.]MCV0334971.1 DUF1761 domain-containing protein [Microbacterium sp.]MCV0376632.1 DUF1761 domain-containing protein [Microbacterium sp.]MCV0391061.1 DUF1761 domain-containing protein [Microbacterium sp.]MCV0420203.1 DUF1761 domain-containing protein [Microbacterium sp.]MCV0422901.1 DUF1761 domain-containing protein [Microbacterium sp.]